MDTIRERLDYALRLRETRAYKLAEELQELNRRRREGGEDPLPWANKERIYEFLRGEKRTTPVDWLEEVARLLKINPSWLAFGTGPCEADVPADGQRELHLVDGALRDFSAPEDPEKRRELRRDFERGFGKPEGFSVVSPTVVVMFVNYMARYFRRCRDESRGSPDLAEWRGREAAQGFADAVRLARNNKSEWSLGRRRTVDDSPEVTGALLWALGSRQMQRPPERKGK